MKVMAMGVKETLEVLEAVKVLAESGKKVLADGKVSIGDIGTLLDLMKKFPVVNAGIQGAELVPVEIKDLDAEEAELLVAKALEIAAIFGVKA